MGCVPAYGDNGNSPDVSCSEPSLYCHKCSWIGVLHKWLTKSASDANIYILHLHLLEYQLIKSDIKLIIFSRFPSSKDNDVLGCEVLCFLRFMAPHCGVEEDQLKCEVVEIKEYCVDYKEHEELMSNVVLLKPSNGGPRIKFPVCLPWHSYIFTSLHTFLFHGVFVFKLLTKKRKFVVK